MPEDIVTRIIELREASESLLDLVRVIPVTTKSGRRTMKKRGQHQGFATVAEAAKFGKTATPQFSTVSYEVEKRGGYLPVTNELLEDSDNNIAAVAQQWLADEARVTANKEILAVIQAKAAQDLKDLDGILTAWVKLGSAFRATSKLITNDDGLLWLGTLKDANGRYLLTP
ncbi:MAG: phage major capsid protein, partial [Oscillospiraceae bacterium]|nr:phage major capsid protein [Oscillospiraceae bacterium]